MDELILATAEEYLDVLCMLLKDTVIRISMEGYRKKTGCILGIATLFQNVAKPRFIKIWYGDPHLGIVLQGSYSKFGDDNCYQKLTHLISYLWRQQNIIFAMRPKVSKVADTCWESMGKVGKWFKRNKVYIDMHVNNKYPDC